MTWNRKMMTTEDVNSVLQNFGKCFIDYFIVDTSILTTEDSVFAYDFITITRTTNTISFNIKNDLWTGAYKILDCNSGVTPTINVSGSTITVTGTGLTYVVLELELSPDFKHNNIFEMDYKVKYKNPVIVPFYETADLTVQFLEDDTPVSDLNVYDILNDVILITDENGEVTVTLDWDKAGDYYYPLQIINNGEEVIYNFPYTRFKGIMHVYLQNYVYRACKNSLDFAFICPGNLDLRTLLTSDNVTLKYNGKKYVGEINESHVHFDADIADVDHVKFELNVQGSHYIDDHTYNFDIEASYVTVNMLTTLREAISNVNNRVVRFIGSGDVSEADFTSIVVDHDIEIIFENVITVENTVPLFTLDNGAELVLDNFNLNDAGRIIEIKDGNVRLNNCNINHVSDTVIRGNGDLQLLDCSFIDNNQVLDVEGDVTADNCLFDLSDNAYLDNSKVPFLDVFGDLNLSYCNFNLELTGLNSLGYSYVCCKIGEGYSTNNVNNNKLFTNESFPIDNNNCNINVESNNYHVTSKSNKSFTWNMINTNTVFSNKLNVEHIGD